MVLFFCLFHQLPKLFCADPSRDMSTQRMLENTKCNFHSTTHIGLCFTQLFTVALLFIVLAWMDNTVYWSIMPFPKTSWKFSLAGIKCMKLRKDERWTGLHQHRKPTEWAETLFNQLKPCSFRVKVELAILRKLGCIPQHLFKEINTHVLWIQAIRMTTMILSLFRFI